VGHPALIWDRLSSESVRSRGHLYASIVVDLGHPVDFNLSFVRPPQLAELTASDGTSNDQFGEAVAISGSTVVVGAPGATIGSNADEGCGLRFREASKRMGQHDAGRQTYSF
jgi:hypothetical protein